MHKLVMKEGLNKGTEYPLHGDEVIFGRSPTCTIRLLDSGVSREHCKLVRENGGWELRDLESKNGTRVNGAMTAKATLKDGDEFEVGGAILRFVSSDGEIVRSPAAAPVAPQAIGGPAPSAPAKPEIEDTRSVARPGAPSPAAKPIAPVVIHRGPAEKLPAQLESLDAVKQLREARERIVQEMQKVIIGQRAVVEHLLVALFSRGHVLLVGVPGLAKTLMVRTLASVLDLDFKRIQFTPDLMPSDITGTDILEDDPESKKRAFKFIRGPIFTNILLADEINRTPPKTQAALLEAMQEYRVTASGFTYDLKLPFFVLATQNPIEQEGTYPLPEAQLDRFMFNIRIDYPKKDEEVAIVRATTVDAEARPRVILSANDILKLQRVVRQVPVSDYVLTYATMLARTTRPKSEDAPGFVNDFVAWGAGPRAAQCLVLGAKASAILDGRVNVSCADVRSVAEIVLRHRVFTNFNADSEGITPEEIIRRVVKHVPEPNEKDFPAGPKAGR